MKQNPFMQKKDNLLKLIEETSPDSPDASPKGTIDALCMPIINLINSSSKMVTTSSCSGRVSVFLEGEKHLSQPIDNNNDSNNNNQPESATTTKPGGKGDGGRWLFITHDVSKVDNWYTDLMSLSSSSSNQNTNTDIPSVANKDLTYCFTTDADLIDRKSNDPSTRYVLFKFEPLILHVLCADLDSASQLYTTAMGTGFRESGIGKNNNVAIRISIKLDVPVGFYEPEEKKICWFVPEYVLKLLTNVSKEKFYQNEKKLKDLYDQIEQLTNSQANNNKSADADTLGQHGTKKTETKEERRLRKQAEGLARREAVREQKQAEKLRKLKLEQERLQGQQQKQEQ